MISYTYYALVTPNSGLLWKILIAITLLMTNQTMIWLWLTYYCIFYQLLVKKRHKHWIFNSFLMTSLSLITSLNTYCELLKSQIFGQKTFGLGRISDRKTFGRETVRKFFRPNLFVDNVIIIVLISIPVSYYGYSLRGCSESPLVLEGDSSLNLPDFL